MNYKEDFIQESQDNINTSLISQEILNAYLIIEITNSNFNI